MLRTCANFGGLPVVSHPRVQPRVSASLHNLEHFFTLFHTLPLNDSHLNTGLLIAKIQANLAWNKANKMVDKIQPYNMHIWTPTKLDYITLKLFIWLHTIHNIWSFKKNTSLFEINAWNFLYFNFESKPLAFGHHTFSLQVTIPFS